MERAFQSREHVNILLVSQYFWPETFIINDLARALASKGHQLQVFTGKPNYPEGQVFPGYTSHGCYSEVYSNQIPVYRVPLRPRRHGAKGLMLNYFSFIFNGLRFFPGELQRNETTFDVIFVFAPSPILSVLPAILLKWKTKAHLAVWVQDLWPESLAATGFVRSPFLQRALGWIVRWIYGCSDTLLIQSKAFRESVSRYANPEKIVYYPNSLELTSLEGSDAALLPDELINVLENSFCAVFAGNIGTAQAIGTLVEAAVHLKKHPQCKLVLVGSGSMLSWVQEQKAALGLDNLILAGRYPMSMMSQIFERAGALVVNLKNEKAFSYTIPSKVQAYLASGRPIVAALNGEGARIVLEAGAGVACPAENAQAIADSVYAMSEMTPEERDCMGAAGKAYFLEHFEMGAQASRLIKILESRIVKKGSRN
jgi:glycosyltransferase involved in cell wall biosynthesis